MHTKLGQNLLPLKENRPASSTVAAMLGYDDVAELSKVILSWNSWLSGGVPENSSSVDDTSDFETPGSISA